MLLSFFLEFLSSISFFIYLCSPMKYLNKPSEKIITTESTGSTKMNFLLLHIDGHIVDRLCFVNIN